MEQLNLGWVVYTVCISFISAGLFLLGMVNVAGWVLLLWGLICMIVEFFHVRQV